MQEKTRPKQKRIYDGICNELSKEINSYQLKTHIQIRMRPSSTS